MAHVHRALAHQKDTVSVVFLGDIEAPSHFEYEIRGLIDAGMRVWFIHGNHDTDSPRSWHYLQGSAQRNLDGRVVEIEGVRVAGLGGIFREEIWHPGRGLVRGESLAFRNYDAYLAALRLKTAPELRRLAKYTGKALKHRSSIFPDVYDRLGRERADILVTHEAPSCHPYGFEAIDVLAQVMGVKTAFHGHHHESVTYADAQERLGFKAYGVGLRAITDMTGCQVLAGQ